MESSGAQKLSATIFCIRFPWRLADSEAGKKPLRLIFALPAVSLIGIRWVSFLCTHPAFWVYYFLGSDKSRI